MWLKMRLGRLLVLQMEERSISSIEVKIGNELLEEIKIGWQDIRGIGID